MNEKSATHFYCTIIIFFILCISFQSLSSNVAFGFGCSYISHYEEEGVGAQWSNIATSPIPGDDYSMLKVMFMLLIDGCIYGIMTWYIEAVWPGKLSLCPSYACTSELCLVFFLNRKFSKKMHGILLKLNAVFDILCTV